MPTRKGNAVWNGSLKEGNGKVKTQTGTLNHAYSFSSRFEEGQGTNPEELIGAAHAGCYSMALSGALGKAGYEPKKVETEDVVHLEKQETGFVITKIVINTNAEVDDLENEEFQRIAEQTKENCPVAKALTGVKFELNASLKSNKVSA